MTRRERLVLLFRVLMFNLRRLGLLFALAAMGGVSIPATAATAPALVTPLDRHLIEKIRSKPCAFLAAALGDAVQAEGNCGRVRRGKRDIVVSIVATDGSKDFDLLTAGQHCPGGFVGVDRRPGMKKRLLSYLEIWLWGGSETTLSFTAGLTAYELLPDGRIESVIHQGCTEKIQAEMHLVGKVWSATGKVGFSDFCQCADEKATPEYRLVPRALPVEDLLCDRADDCEIVFTSELETCRTDPDVEPYAISRSAAARHRSQKHVRSSLPWSIAGNE